MLPSVNITFNNGALGRTAATTDGVVGLICQIVAEGIIVPGQVYLLKSKQNLAELGITKATNPALVNIVTDFYDNAGNGAALWVVGYITQALPQAITAYTKTLVQSSSYDVKTVFVYGEANGVVTTGFKADLLAAVTNAQLEATQLTNTFYAPIAIIIDGNTAYEGTAANVINYSTAANNRVGIFLGKKESAVNNTTCLGLVMARVAIAQVHRNIGRVKDGAIFTGNLYVGTQLAELHDVATLHDRGFITVRTFVGKSGYYFTDDRLATALTDDYAQLTNRRVIDKAYRIAYSTLANELLDEIAVNADGTIQAHKALVIESLIISAITNAMTAAGELSADETNNADKGVVATVDRTNNILSNSTININIGVRPYGYSRFINVQIGFKTT